MIKLHIGCGTLYKEGWVNIDNNSDNNIERLDINHDLSKGLPFEDESVDYIYNEHFIEHLAREDGLKFLYECHRVLKIGGVLRISCPDLDFIIDGYIHNTWREQDWVKKYNYDWIESECQMLNLNLNQIPWGHKYVYNQKELTKQLEKVGFDDNIKKELFAHSIYSELNNIDSRIDGMFFEATKTTRTKNRTELDFLFTNTKFIQLFLDENNGFLEKSSIKFPVLEETQIQKFEFNFTGKQNIKNLRLDPLNDSCIIEIKSLSLITDHVEIDLLPHISTNACAAHDKSYFFDTEDSNIYFEGLAVDDFKGAEKLIAMIYFIHKGEDALRVSVKQIKAELAQTKAELAQIKCSLSWKITKPLRKVKSIMKGIR